MLLRGASVRWGVFHKGSELEVSGWGSELRATLTYPPFMFNALLVRGFAEGIRAGLRLSRATTVAMNVEDVGPRKAQLHAVWT